MSKFIRINVHYFDGPPHRHLMDVSDMTTEQIFEILKIADTFMTNPKTQQFLYDIGECEQPGVDANNYKYARRTYSILRCTTQHDAKEQEIAEKKAQVYTMNVF